MDRLWAFLRTDRSRRKRRSIAEQIPSTEYATPGCPDCEAEVATRISASQEKTVRRVTRKQDESDPMSPTDRDDPRGKTVHRLFEEQAQRTPEAVAVVFGEERLTYRQLNERANRLARHLGKLGVGPEVLVGLFVERSLDTVVGILAILKAGGAYVPLDPGYPRQRLEFMVKDSAAPVVVTQEDLSTVLPDGDFRRVRLDADWAEIERESAENPESHSTPHNLAYVIYTSGSTGKPKGVMIEHRSVANLFAATQPELGFGQNDVWTVFHSYAFDLSVWEIFGALLHGGRLVVVPRELTQSPSGFAQLLAREGVTMLAQTPAAARQLAAVREDPASRARDWKLRLIICGGEALPADLAAELLSWNVPLWNFYGPTESTVWTTVKRVEPTECRKGIVPIGHPLADTEAYVLDRQMRPVSAGVSGDLYIGGVGLARGYLRRPELDRERFVPHPFRHEPGGRLYRTGDRARRLPDGAIEFLGRDDYQVKIRGYRVELGEIEEVLAEHPAIRQAVVLAREDGPGDKRLVAYIVAPETPHPTSGALRGFLRSKLPEYMVPLAFVFLEALPLTSNGKVDRLSLPLPPPDRHDLDTPFLAPSNPLEEALCGMFAQLLSLEVVGIDDNFFELGGHSVIATQLVSRVRTAFQVEVPLSQFFQSPTVRETAGWISQAKRQDGTNIASIPRSPRTGSIPLSLPQENVWFLQKLQPDNRAYYFQPMLRLHGELDTAVLRRTLDEIVRRHEIYRTTFPTVAATPVQQIHERASASLTVFDLQDLPEDQREAELRRRIDEEIRQPFDLTKLPLIRWTLFRLGPEENVLQHVEHHMVHDGWSFNVFLRELATLYRSFREGGPSPLPDPEIQFADFACFQQRWMETEQAAAQRAYWTKKLGPPPAPLEIPSDRPRPAVRTFRGAAPNVELPVDLAEALRALSRREGCTLFMTMLATFAVLLHRYTSREDFCIGSGIANRRWVETEGLIGMLVNTVALRMDLAGDPTFTELLRRVRDVTLEGYENQDYPFAAVVDAARPERTLSHLPLCQVFFSFHDSPLAELDFGGMQLTDLKEIVSNGSAKFDLNIVCIPRSEQRVGHRAKAPAGGITIAWEYDTDLFDEATARRMIGHFETLLRAIASDPERSVSSLPLLTEPEKHDVLQDWNSRQAACPRTYLHESFERQVERAPGAVAVEFEGERLTYAELNRRCNQLAWHLRKLGVGPGVLVGVCLERSLEMVIALIGVLKSGGAYVPLDPAYPAERLAFMLEDAETPVLLTEGKLLDSLRVPGGVRVCLVDLDAQVIGLEDGRNPERLGSPESPAYVIYTSGSTGKPKGVLVTHANVDRLFTATEPWFQFDEQDVWTLFHSYAFDFSVWELWGALGYGGRLVVVPLAVARSPEAFHALLVRSGVTVLNQTPSAFRQLIARDISSVDSLSLRLVIFGGEALEPGILKPWFDRHGDESPSLVNMYGITETTVHVTYHPVTRADLLQPSVSVIGRPIPDLQVYILDPHLQLCPIGIPGELYVAGAGLALGYLRRPELTSERFIPNPFATEPGERLYKTGDLGRYRPSGEIEYLGRIDQQVKIRGYRIELGEIEAVLAQHPNVREAVVVAREDTSGGRSLVAYIVENGESPSVSEIRTFLKRSLPDYMVPSTYVRLERLPLTPSGKVDRRSLPSPDLTRPGLEQAFVAPRTAVEQLLAGIWAQVLSLERVGIHDNFFELGGHSLLATRLMARIRDDLHVELPLRSLFEFPTISGLVEAIERARQDGEVVLPEIQARPRVARRVEVLPGGEVAASEE
jgi:amino acid adenylation domain-containing protein